MAAILCFGDSNTYGYIPGGAGRYPWEQRYAGALAAALGAGYTVTADGLVGRTTVFEDRRPGRRGLDALEAALTAAEPEILVLMLGTNDCKAQFGANAARVAAGMAALTELAWRVQPGMRCVWVAPPVLAPEALLCGDYNENSLITSHRLAGAYEALAGRLGCAFWDAARSAAVSRIDGEHLRAEGQQALGRSLAEIVRRCS